jgi:dihydrofolate synthase/folylpolyglutamate synthase
MRYSLLKISKFFLSIGNPHLNLKTIHIAGTNGKGSTAAFICEILQSSGYKVALYTSPHLIDITERIQINGINIPKDTFNSISQTYLKKAIKYQLSYFEYLTVVAIIYFVEQQVDIAIIESGIGGRLDATNIIKNTMICIITSISKDHQEILGNTLQNIAFEKAGIIKKNAYVICGKLPKTIIESLYKKTNRKLYAYGVDIQGILHNIDQYKQQFDYINKYDNLKIKSIETRMLGIQQMINASLSICTANLLNKIGYNVSENNIRNGIKNTKWIGRFDIINIQTNNNKFKLIVDGAHNSHGVYYFFHTLKQLNLLKEKRIIIFAVMKDKKYKIMIEYIIPFAKEIILPYIHNTRAVDPKILKKEFSKYIALNKIHIVYSIKEALNMRSYNNEIVLILGSLYLVGEVLSFLKYSQVFQIIK